MYFNNLVKFLLEGGFKAPIDTKRPVKVPNMSNHGTVSPYFNNKTTTSAHSGFKGDSLNPSIFTSIFKLPRSKRVKNRGKLKTRYT